MHQYKRERAEKIIEDIFKGEYIAAEEKESKNYFFVSYKHKLYDEDDDRAVRVGVRLLVFYKSTGEYKLSGTGDILGDTFEGEMKEAYGYSDEPDSKFVKPLIPEIIAGIQRRRYVNLLDAQFMLESLNEQYPGIEDAIRQLRRDIPYSEYFIFISNNPEYIQAITGLWDSFGFRYHWVDNDLLLHRSKE